MSRVRAGMQLQGAVTVKVSFQICSTACGVTQPWLFGASAGPCIRPHRRCVGAGSTAHS
jgi:hypothetical protein